MIISASRRTDIPLYFADSFIEWLKAGFCDVKNPFNANQVTRVSLKQSDVTGIVFWTRYPAPLLKYLDMIDEMGYKYYFLFTLNNYPKNYEINRFELPEIIDVFRKLSDRLGKGRLIWRYDPIIVSERLSYNFHLENFNMLCNELNGFTDKVITSIVTPYRKTINNLKKVDTSIRYDFYLDQEFKDFISSYVAIAQNNNIFPEICCSPVDLSEFGLANGKCIDEKIFEKEYDFKVNYKKDKNQRPNCHCMISKDIGSNNSCRAGCLYCYATRRHQF